MKILIVDDDVSVLELLSTFFSSLGHTVVTTTNSTEVEKYVIDEIFDLLMLDIKFPEIDGIEVLKSVKKIDPSLPVVMMTGYKEAERIIEAFRLGAMDCLLKPFNFDYIKENILSKIVERKK